MSLLTHGTSFLLFFFPHFLFFHCFIFYRVEGDGGKDKQEKQEKGQKEGEDKEKKGEKEGVKGEKAGEKAMQSSRAAVADQLCTSQVSSASRLSECLQSKLNALKSMI